MGARRRRQHHHLGALRGGRDSSREAPLHMSIARSASPPEAGMCCCCRCRCCCCCCRCCCWRRCCCCGGRCCCWCRCCCCGGRCCCCCCRDVRTGLASDAAASQCVPVSP